MAIVKYINVSLQCLMHYLHHTSACQILFDADETIVMLKQNRARSVLEQIESNFILFLVRSVCSAEPLIRYAQYNVSGWSSDAFF